MLYRVHDEETNELCCEFIRSEITNNPMLESTARRETTKLGFGSGKGRNYIVTKQLNHNAQAEPVLTFLMGMY